jgi:hypothetical protein
VVGVNDVWTDDDRRQVWRLERPGKQQPPYLLTFAEAGQLMGLTENTVRRYVDIGKLGYVLWRWRYGRIARRRRYVPRVCAVEFLERRSVLGNSA